MQKHNRSSKQKPEYHLLNTSGVFNYPECHLDWVRVGIGLYGFANHPRWNETLQPIAQLKTKITQIHEIKSGETVGYNCGWRATKKTRIAVLPIGHADGFSRQYGHGKGWVLVNGKKAYVVGNVCMDMVMVDIGDIPCNEESEVVVIGSGIRADDLAENAGTISYELLSSLEIAFQESSKLKSLSTVINQTICWDFEKKPIEVVDKVIKLIFAKNLIHEISSCRRNRNGRRGDASGPVREKFPIYRIDSCSFREIYRKKLNVEVISTKWLDWKLRFP